MLASIQTICSLVLTTSEQATMACTRPRKLDHRFQNPARMVHISPIQQELAGFICFDACEALEYRRDKQAVPLG
jgi:hypothetical protein